LSELSFDCVVVGAGIVGVCCARQLAETGLSVVVLERNAKAGMETSSRNSGVIHAGLYYPPGSLKASSCVDGRERLYQRCLQLGIPHRAIGKLLVASDASELPKLEALHGRAIENGVASVRWLERREITALAPGVKAYAALWSPRSGIVDAHALVDAHRRLAIDHDVVFCFRSAVTALDARGGGWSVAFVDADGTGYRVRTRAVVNAAGLHATELCTLAGVDTGRAGLQTHYCKGDYFAVSSNRGALEHLVYPMPTDAGLGVHLTLNLAGEVYAGPDTEYVERLHYDVDARKADLFCRAVSRYYPGLTPDDFRPAYAGIRPKLQGPSQPFRDFVVDDMRDRGAPGFIAMVGIESPGLTAAEALALRVLQLVNTAIDG